MNTLQGFTLFDLLLTLVFISGTAIGLLTQQGQTSHLLNAGLYDANTLNSHTNYGERHAAFRV
ncbi:hypothetical protein [Legionella sp. CNM-4043-24]|uniref:hypothetical protein n=1 Tax=Legionella sp. CNM-4043-24 TaxID=3421646 RepID=UPI00403A8B17